MKLLFTDLDGTLLNRDKEFPLKIWRLSAVPHAREYNRYF